MSKKKRDPITLFCALAFEERQTATQAQSWIARRWMPSQGWKDFLPLSQRAFQKFGISQAGEFEHVQNWPEISPKNWKRFVERTSSEEFLLALWVLVLGIEPASVAEALNLPMGTVYHRLNQAVSHFSEIARPTRGANA